MKEIIHPKWDKVTPQTPLYVQRDSSSGQSSERIPFSKVHDPVKVGMTISAHYKGEFVGLTVIEAITETEFIAKIITFSPPAENPENLTINKPVRINRDEISGITLI